ncbi:MAG: hypothetical protein ACLFRX_01965 [Gemmatimonadota bacterium]
MRYPLTAMLALVIAWPAAAQEWQVARESFAFAGTRLRILVQADAPGTLQVIRGAPGSVRVASRAVRGFTAAGLADTEELTLTAAGHGPVDYMVAVPEGVWVDVNVPERMGQAIAGSDGSRTFEWGPAAARQRGVADWLAPPEGEVAPLEGGDAPLFTTYAADETPRVVTLPRLETVRSVSVRIQGDGFRVLTSRPLAVDRGASARVVIRTGEPAMDLVVVVPRHTREFRLETGQVTALVIDGDRVTPLCSPVIDQRLSDDRRWLTFSPREGTLRCDPPTTPRHEG